MKKTDKKKLALDRTTVRSLQDSLVHVNGAYFPASLGTCFFACASDEACGPSHHATCGRAKQCASEIVCPTDRG